jgi:hypothetical protein
MNDALENRRNDGKLSTPEQEDSVLLEAEDNSELPKRIERTDIEPKPIPVGATEIVLQRHGRYVRDVEDAQKGSLTEEAVELETQEAKSYFERFLGQLTDEEKQTVDVLVLASDTQYHYGGRRSYETGNIALDAAKSVFKDVGIAEENIHNTREVLVGDGQSRPMSKLREPQFIDNSPEFTDYLKEKYGDMTLDFWIAFEEDTESEMREELGAEGPDDIADRTNRATAILARYAQNYHRLNPGRRLVIWAATHYDTISPYVKRDIFGVGKEVPLQVDYGAGITIDIDTNGDAETVIDGKVYQVPVK